MSIFIAGAQLPDEPDSATLTSQNTNTGYPTTQGLREFQVHRAAGCTPWAMSFTAEIADALPISLGRLYLSTYAG